MVSPGSRHLYTRIMSTNAPRRSAWWIALSSVVLFAASGCGASDDSPAADSAAVTSSAAPTTDATSDAPSTTGKTDATDAATETGAPAATGWAVHDAITSEQSGAVTKYDAISCQSELGPWHIVASFEAGGNLTQDVFYDVTMVAGGSGPLTGEEHTTWDSGLVVDGTKAGTAALTPTADTFTLTLDYDESISIVDPVSGASVQNGHRTKELEVGPAAAGDCG